MTDRGLSMLRVGVACATLLALGGCHFLRGGGACYKPAAYERAEDRPPLKVPPGLKTPDTSQALRIPQINEPAPPRRKKGESCLDEPPAYMVPKGKPQPAA